MCPNILSVPTGLLIAALLMAVPPSIAAPALFSDPKCDFEVTFPTEFSSKGIFKGDDVGVFATSRSTGSVKLSAECWPRVAVSMRDFIANAKEGIVRQGIAINAATLEKTSAGEIVVITGQTDVKVGLFICALSATLGQDTEWMYACLTTTQPVAQNTSRFETASDAGTKQCILGRLA